MFIEQNEKIQLVPLADIDLQRINGGMGYHDGVMDNAALFNCFVEGFWAAMH